MAGGVAAADPGEAVPRTKLFISYSRKDMAFVDRLEAALKERGFEPLVDRAEIYAFEDWWKRIEALIGRGDTVIFVLTPDSVASEICAREVAHAASLNKRFAPIVLRRVEDKQVPEALSRLNFIFFDDEARFNESMQRLCEALATDIAWIRKHTDYGEAARLWAAGRASGLLLRSPALEEAERWIAARPPNAPAPTEDTQAFIAESRRGATRRRNILTSSLATGLVVALALAGLAYWQRGIAIAQRQYAEQALDASIRTSNSLSLDLAMRLRNRTGIQSSLVKYLLDQALRLEEQITSFGRITPDLLTGEARALIESAKTRRVIGDIPGALADADRARQTFEHLLLAKPDDPDAQLNLNVSLELTGDMLLAQGKSDDALAAYRKALATAQAVADADPGNGNAQEDLAIDDVHIGDVLQAQLKLDDALGAYRASLAIRQKLIAQSHDDTRWQRGLGISYERIADILLAQRKGDEAFDAAQKRLGIAQTLADGNRDDTELQRELSVANNKIGDLSLAAGKYAEALGSYQKGLAIRQSLADSDQDNALWQRDLAISNNNIGAVMAAQGKSDEALAAYQKGIAIERRLARGDPDNIGWQTDIAISDSRIGDLLKGQGKLEPALQAFDDCVDVAQRVLKVRPNERRWQQGFQFCVVQINLVGYRFVIARDFAHGLAAAEQSISLAPDMIWLNAHRAHALMFLGRIDEARTIYLRYRDDKNVLGNEANPMSWSKLVVQEFAELRQEGLMSPLMDEIEKELGDGG
jgi:tetratricopeptide (TPR) repeat protein